MTDTEAYITLIKPVFQKNMVINYSGVQPVTCRVPLFASALIRLFIYNFTSQKWYFGENYVSSSLIRNGNCMKLSL